MSIVYLQQRIEFLEKAMTVLFEKHHLKGLHLLHRVTREEADSNYK